MSLRFLMTAIQEASFFLLEMCIDDNNVISTSSFIVSGGEVRVVK